MTRPKRLKTTKQEPVFKDLVFALNKNVFKSNNSIRNSLTCQGATILTGRSSKNKVANYYLTSPDAENDIPAIKDTYGNQVQIVSSEFVSNCLEAECILDAKPFEIEIQSFDTTPLNAVKTNDNVQSVDQIMEKEKTDTMVKVIKKGVAVVDFACPMASQYHVYSDGTEIYDCMLNQTNISTNNNKFYLIQLLQQDVGSQYYVWKRWGRVGMNGQTSLLCFTNLSDAINDFEKKFHEKTLNAWQDRHQFVHHARKYVNLERDYGDLTVPSQPEKTLVPSKLSSPVQDLIQMIFNVKLMEQQMMEIGYDSKKLPLGKLSKSLIHKGYEILESLSKELRKKNPSSAQLDKWSSLFYTHIPHDFRMSRPPMINSNALLKKKIEMLESLAEIEIATKLIQDSSVQVNENPIDLHYKSLGCQISCLNSSDAEFDMIQKYLLNTHGKTHTGYKLQVLQVYEMQHQKHEYIEQVGTRMLLWHGSRISNFAGILSQGLRIAPPEAPSTGYMFGKGIYFADMVSKSANYCYASRDCPQGLLLLCEVGIGKTLELHSSNYDADKECKNKGYHSTKGLGRIYPNPQECGMMHGNLVPFGSPMEDKDKKSDLIYNEYIVYDTRQVSIKYLVKVSFDFL